MALFTPIWMKEGLEGKRLLKAEEAVGRMTSQEDLRKVVLQAKHGRVIDTAVRRIDDEAFLARVALGQERAASESALFCAAERLTDQAALAQVAQASPYEHARIAAIKRMDDPLALLEIAGTAKGLTERKRAAEALDAAVRACTDQKALRQVAMTCYSLMGSKAPRIATERITDQGALAELALSASDARLRETALQHLEDIAVLSEIALSDCENAWLAARRLEPRSRHKDKEERTRALARIAVEAPRDNARTEAVKQLTTNGLEAELRARIVLNDPAVCEEAARFLPGGELARKVLVDWVGEGALATNRKLGLPQKDALAAALVKVAGKLGCLEDAQLAVETLSKLDARRFELVTQAARRKVAEFGRALRRYRCSRCGQPVLFAVEAGKFPRGAFTCGCADGPDAACWESVTPDDSKWGIPNGEFVWVCTNCHGLKSDMRNHELPSQGRCGCPDRPYIFGVKRHYNYSDDAENAVRVGVVEMDGSAIKELPPLREDASKATKGAKARVLVCPACGKEAKYVEEFESIDSYRIFHGFRCSGGCGMCAADAEEALYKFKVAERSVGQKKEKDHFAYLCPTCAKMVGSETSWRDPTYLGKCTCINPHDPIRVRILIDM